MQARRHASKGSTLAQPRETPPEIQKRNFGGPTKYTFALQLFLFTKASCLLFLSPTDSHPERDDRWWCRHRYLSRHDDSPMGVHPHWHDRGNPFRHRVRVLWCKYSTLSVIGVCLLWSKYSALSVIRYAYYSVSIPPSPS